MAIQDLISTELKENLNINETVFASVARIATNSSTDFTNKYNTGAHLVIDVTAVPGIETVTFVIEGKDVVSGKYYAILTSAALVATGTIILKIYPGITIAANLAVSDILPATYRVTVIHSAAGSFTYSVGISRI